MNHADLLLLAAPEAIVVLAALAVLGVDLLVMRGREAGLRRVVGASIAAAGCAGAIAWLMCSHGEADAFRGMLVADPLTRWVKTALLVMTILTLVLSGDSDFTPHAGEYAALILLAAVGMMFLVSSEDILMIFIALELTSLSLYILAGFNKRSILSAEAALKYFLFGGMSAAFTLFGLSLIYGLSGATNLRDIAMGLAGRGMDPLLAVAIVMVIIGFGFKVAAAPFHLWAPDVYQGAPAPSAAFIASGSKVASFFILAKVMSIGFNGAQGGASPGWIWILGLVAALSMVLGNLAAIVQSSVRRLLAYSAIAHAGYMLLAVLSDHSQSLESLLYYAVTYGLATIGAFAVVAVVERARGGDRMEDFAGLSRQSPMLSICMLVFLLSLAGIPPLAGFFGKFYVFTAALNGGPGFASLWLVILAIATSAVSLYYYLQVLKRIYVSDLPEGSGIGRVPVMLRMALVAIAGGVILLGCAPNLLLDSLSKAIESVKFL